MCNTAAGRFRVLDVAALLAWPSITIALFHADRAPGHAQPLTIALFALLLSLIGGCGGREASPAALGTATVSGVAGGDAIRLTDGRTLPLRGIDAPAPTTSNTCCVSLALRSSDRKPAANKDRATGLEPATSSVTRRSWGFRAWRA
jgi:hypothetical protein